MGRAANRIPRSVPEPKPCTQRSARRSVLLSAHCASRAAGRAGPATARKAGRGGACFPRRAGASAAADLGARSGRKAGVPRRARGTPAIRTPRQSRRDGPRRPDAQTARLHRWRDRAIACHFLAALERPKEPNPSPRLAAIPIIRGRVRAVQPRSRRSRSRLFGSRRPLRWAPVATTTIPACRRARGFKANRSSSWPTCENSDTGQAITPSLSILARSRINRTRAGASSLVQSTTPATPRAPARPPALGPSARPAAAAAFAARPNGVGGAATPLIVRGWQQPVRHGADFRTADTQRHSPGGFRRGVEGTPPLKAWASRPRRSEHSRGVHLLAALAQLQMEIVGEPETARDTYDWIVLSVGALAAVGTVGAVSLNHV